MPAVLNKGGMANAASVSCPSGGRCTAAGEYAVGTGHNQLFVVSQGEA